MCFNEEYIDLYNNFTKMLKLAYIVKFSRNLIQIIFLQNYSIQLLVHEIKMVLSEKGNTRFKNLLNDVDLITSRKSVVNTSVPSLAASVSSRLKDKRGFHTFSFRRSSSSISTNKNIKEETTNLYLINPEKLMYFNSIK